MLAGLPEFQEGKERFGLHLDMAEKCVKVFQDHKLLDVASVEQVGAKSVERVLPKLTNASPLLRALTRTTKNLRISQINSSVC